MEPASFRAWYLYARKRVPSGNNQTAGCVTLLPMKQINLRVPEDLLAKIDVERKELGESRNACITRLIQEGLSKGKRTGLPDAGPITFAATTAGISSAELAANEDPHAERSREQLVEELRSTHPVIRGSRVKHLPRCSCGVCQPKGKP